MGRVKSPWVPITFAVAWLGMSLLFATVNDSTTERMVCIAVSNVWIAAWWTRR